MALSNTNMDGRLSAIANVWLQNTFQSFFLQNIPLFQMLEARGHVQTEGFGITMRVPIRFPLTTGPAVVPVADSATAYSSITFAEMTGFSGYEWTAAEYVLPLSVQKYDLAAQGTMGKRVDWVQGVMQQGLDKFKFKLIADMWANEEVTTSAGTRAAIASIRTLLNAGGASTTANTAPPLARTEQGLDSGGSIGRAVVGTVSSTAVYTVGGINRNAALAAHACTPIIQTSQAFTPQVLSGIMTKATCGQERPDLILVTENVFDKIQGLISAGANSGAGQFLQNSKLAELGFDAVRFRGAEVVADENVPSGLFKTATTTPLTSGDNIFAINTGYLSMKVQSKKPKIEPHDDPRPILAWTAEWRGQLIGTNLGRVHSRHVWVTT